MRCSRDRQLQAYIDGELADPGAAELKRHLDACPDCRERLAQLRSAGEQVKVKIASLDPAQIPAPPPLPTEDPPRPARTSAFWRRLVTASIRVPAAVGAMAGLFACGVALGAVLKISPGATVQPRHERRVEPAGVSLQGTVSIEVSSLGLNLEDYSPVAQPRVFTIKEP
jgi:anti-sigma factor RsiW